MILCIETSSTVCSVALFHKGEVLAIEESFMAKNHSTVIIPMVDHVMAFANASWKDLKAIAVSSGPGSYTGLRIGVSTAKGFCSAMDIPLIAVPTLQAIARGFISQNTINEALICPMFDARRMEVYYWLGDAAGNEVHEVQPLVLEEGVFGSFLEKQKIYFIGEGSKKASVVLNHQNAAFVPEFQPSARWIGPVAEERLEKGIIEDLAYFEPFYLKETVVMVKKTP